ncbi:hypothetical protein [Cellulosilyticum sp. I15G10I2]|uniref:hypothetical protein n=1 Tax=Cellulosilyticum sp. I15G10I2 TaxID=1892843 RepID=UPI00085BDF28|nr:hypothetical protein [Cellulosilyticum sp. I15G10I2]
MKSSVVQIVINLYIGLIGLFYIGVMILKKVYELELIREDLYFYLLIAISFGILISILINTKKNSIIIIFLLTIILILFTISSRYASKYILLESPSGKHKIIAQNTLVGFETGATKFYRVQMLIFKKYLNAIILEKTGGVIINDKLTTLQWINEDILEIRFKYHYNNELHIYKVNFNTNKISTDISILR